MRALFIAVLLLFLGYMMMLPAHQYWSLRQATQATAQGRFESARTRVLPLLQEKPAFFRERTVALCREIDLQQATTLVTQAPPDFARAVRLLHTHAERCQAGDSPDTQALLERVAALHVAQATERCGRQDYEAALTIFQAVTTLPYPERVLRQARQESGWCRLSRASTYATQRWFAEATDEVTRALESDAVDVRRAAFRVLPTIVGQEVTHWLNEGQPIRAFEVFNERRQRFGEEPEMARFFWSLESQMDMQAFGMLLAQPCLSPKKAQSPKLMPVVAVNTQLSGFAKTNLALRNKLASEVRLLIRGPVDDVLLLKPREQRSVWLAPGHYLVGMYAPGKCEVMPKHAHWQIDPLVHHTIEVLMEDNG